MSSPDSGLDGYDVYAVAFCGVKEAVMAVMVRSGLKALVGERRFYPNVDRALADLEPPADCVMI
jgi:hypothetical protein